MKGFGNVDFVIADLADDQSVRQFVSVEMQAVDITGSVEPAFRAITNNVDETERFSYGINWANVRKRYVTQLVTKGFSIRLGSRELLPSSKPQLTSRSRSTLSLTSCRRRLRGILLTLCSMITSSLKKQANTILNSTE